MVKWIFPFLFFVLSDKHLCLVLLLAGVGGARCASPGRGRWGSDMEKQFSHDAKVWAGRS